MSEGEPQPKDPRLLMFPKALEVWDRLYPFVELAARAQDMDPKGYMALKSDIHPITLTPDSFDEAEFSSMHLNKFSEAGGTATRGDFSVLVVDLLLYKDGLAFQFPEDTDTELHDPNDYKLVMGVEVGPTLVHSSQIELLSAANWNTAQKHPLNLLEAEKLLPLLDLAEVDVETTLELTDKPLNPS